MPKSVSIDVDKPVSSELGLVAPNNFFRKYIEDQRYYAKKKLQEAQSLSKRNPKRKPFTPTRNCELKNPVQPEYTKIGSKVPSTRRQSHVSLSESTKSELKNLLAKNKQLDKTLSKKTTKKDTFKVNKSKATPFNYDKFKSEKKPNLKLGKKTQKETDRIQLELLKSKFDTGKKRDFNNVWRNPLFSPLKSEKGTVEKDSFSEAEGESEAESEAESEPESEEKVQDQCEDECKDTSKNDKDDQHLQVLHISKCIDEKIEEINIEKVLSLVTKQTAKVNDDKKDEKTATDLKMAKDSQEKSLQATIKSTTFANENNDTDMLTKIKLIGQQMGVIDNYKKRGQMYVNTVVNLNSKKDSKSKIPEYILLPELITFHTSNFNDSCKICNKIICHFKTRRDYLEDKRQIIEMETLKKQSNKDENLLNVFPFQVCTNVPSLHLHRPIDSSKASKVI